MCLCETVTVCALAHLLLLMGEIEYGARGSSFLGDDWYWGRGRGRERSR